MEYKRRVGNPIELRRTTPLQLNHWWRYQIEHALMAIHYDKPGPDHRPNYVALHETYLGPDLAYREWIKGIPAAQYTNSSNFRLTLV